MICGYDGCRCPLPYQLSGWFYHLLVAHDLGAQAAMTLFREMPAAETLPANV